MDYTTYVLEQALSGDGPSLTDHGPATPNKVQAERRIARRDGYRAILMIDTEIYLTELEVDTNTVSA